MDSSSSSSPSPKLQFVFKMPLPPQPPISPPTFDFGVNGGGGGVNGSGVDTGTRKRKDEYGAWKLEIEAASFAMAAAVGTTSPMSMSTNGRPPSPVPCCSKSLLKMDNGRDGDGDVALNHKRLKFEPRTPGNSPTKEEFPGFGEFEGYLDSSSDEREDFEAVSPEEKKKVYDFFDDDEEESDCDDSDDAVASAGNDSSIVEDSEDEKMEMEKSQMEEGQESDIAENEEEEDEDKGELVKLKHNGANFMMRVKKDEKPATAPASTQFVHVCHICEAKFAKRHHLGEHLIDEHLSPDSFACVKCTDLKFSGPMALYRHILLNHPVTDRNDPVLSRIPFKFF